MFIYPIYNHNWRNISTIYIYITRLASNEIFLPSNKIHREVGRAKDLSAPRYSVKTCLGSGPDAHVFCTEEDLLLTLQRFVYSGILRGSPTLVGRPQNLFLKHKCSDVTMNQIGVYVTFKPKAGFSWF